jgi:hypothetical protein
MGISRFPIRPGVDLRNINSASPCRWPAGREKPPTEAALLERAFLFFQ